MSIVYLAEPGGQPTSYTEEQAQSLWQRGALPPTTLFWKDGLADWRPAAEFLGSAGVLPPAPAPMTAPVPTDTVAPSSVAPAAVRARAAYSLALEKDPTGLTTFVKVMMWICLGLAAIAVVFAAVTLSAGPVAKSPDAELTPKDLLEFFLGIAQVLAYVVTSIPFLMWVHLANRNARSLGARGMQFTPGWAVGWYFVPFANLWKPYQVMKEIWQASHNPRSWASVSASLVSNWWGLWLLSNFLGQWSFRLAFRAQTPQVMFSAQLVSMLSDLVEIPLCLVAIRMLDSICRRQIEWVQGAQ